MNETTDRVEVVEAGAGEQALGRVARQPEQRAGGQRASVQPGDEDAEARAQPGDAAARVQGLHDHVVAVQRDGRQVGDAHRPRQPAQEAVDVVPCNDLYSIYYWTCPEIRKSLCAHARRNPLADNAQRTKGDK